MVPSKFQIVRRDTKIRECIRIMQETASSFVLVEDRQRQLVGIFTLKDMLKGFRFLQSETQLNKPVSTIMSRPVQTIQAHQVKSAPQIMAKNSIRHLPVLSDKLTQKGKVIGVIDMESFLQSEILKQRRKGKRSKDVAVFSPTGALLKVLKSALSEYELIRVDKMWGSKLRTQAQLDAYVGSYDLFFFDLEDDKALQFALRFGLSVRMQKKKMIALVSPGRFQSDTAKANLKKLAGYNRVRVFAKPINIHDIIFECLD